MPLTEKDYRDVVKEVRAYVPRLKIKPDEDVLEMMEKGTQACFCQEDNTIYTREPEYYRSKGMLRHVLFHEVGHWACRVGRAGKIRKFAKDVRPLNYALEEMIVDTVSFHFCVMSGHRYNARSHERYIRIWAQRGGLDKFWSDNLEQYFNRKVNLLISFIFNYKKNS